MDKSTAEKLVALNSKFYQTFASHFSATRMRLQPGVGKILDNLPFDADILDLGCGNGELGRDLAQRGHQGVYLGVDFSNELLTIAQTGMSASQNNSFLQADLAALDWDLRIREFINLELSGGKFDVILCFATLHHLPGRDLQNRTCRKVHDLLNPGGRFIHSNWQFLNSHRLRERIQPWEEIDLTPEDVDPGDYLLDWRQGGRGLRYVHHFDQNELIRLAEQTGFRIVEWFHSDGEGKNLGLYHIWETGINES